ncbi:MAG TPA: DnaA/Hda family protein [Methylovirgula sp.]
MVESPSKPGSSAFRGQLALNLELPPHFGRDDFLAAPANAAALHMIEAWPDWPDQLLLLLGPPGAGKSHLAAIWAARAGAEIIAVRTLAEADLFALAERPALVLEDAEEIGAAEAPLFHLINLVRERKASLLLTAQQRPAAWSLATPDLLSRLRLAPVAELEPPDDALLKAGLVKLFNDRQLSVDAAVVDYIALHIDRSFDMARRIVALLDREALARGGKVTRAMARALLRGLRIDDEDDA